MAAPMKSSTSPAPIFGAERAQAEAVPWTGSGELQLRQMSEEPMVIALPKRHSRAALAQIDLALLKENPFLLYPREMGQGKSFLPFHCAPARS